MLYIYKHKNGNTVSIRAVLLTVMLVFSSFLRAQTNTLPENLDSAIRDGNVKKASELCSEAAFSAETAAEGARINTIMSILLFLNLDPDAKSRANSIGDFFIGTDDKDEKAAAMILDFLAGKISDRKLYKAIQGNSPDWIATAAIAMYVKTLHDSGIQPAQLNAYVKAYMAASEKLERNSWGNVWRNRLVKWHNSLQNPLNNTDGLEKLIVKVQKEAATGPIKEQLATLNDIINSFLKGNKSSALSAIKRASAEIKADKNKPNIQPYAQILDYLSGKTNDSRGMYNSCSKNPDLFLMASIAAFIRNLTTSKPGDLQKNVLLAHLDNYSNNFNNAKQQDAVKWKDTVEKWKQWCSSDFPASDNLPQLFATHSNAIAAVKQRAAEQDKLLKLYYKIKNIRRLNRVSISDFKEERKIFQDRPRPASLTFSSSEVQKYITTLPYELQQSEWRRFAYVKLFKSNLIKDLNFSQYKGNIRIKQRTSRGEKIRSYRAQVTEADEQYITIKIGRSKKRLKWSSFPVEQLITFASSYVKNNIGGKNARSNIFSSREATEKALVKEYRILALFCDWYGKYNEALMYAKQADALKYDKGNTKLLLLQ